MCACVCVTRKLFTTTWSDGDVVLICLPRHDLVDGGKGIFSLFWEARVMSGRGHSFCLDQFRWVVGFGWKGGGGDIEVGS